jgi:hypothetical protein
VPSQAYCACDHQDSRYGHLSELDIDDRFFGNPVHLKFMKNELQKEFKGRDDVDVLVPETTSGLKSFDGIEICALRVLDEV